MSKTAKVMKSLFAIAKQLNLVANEDVNIITNLPRHEGDAIFNQAFEFLCSNIYEAAPKRRQETICVTIADKLYRRLRRRIGDNNYQRVVDDDEEAHQEN